jgi:hypothetical protein
MLEVLSKFKFMILLFWVYISMLRDMVMYLWQRKSCLVSANMTLVLGTTTHLSKW